MKVSDVKEISIVVEFKTGQCGIVILPSDKKKALLTFAADLSTKGKIQVCELPADCKMIPLEEIT